MIDLKDLRQDPEKYRRGAAAKQIEVDLDGLLEVDRQLREAMAEREKLAAEKNQIGKQIGPLMGRLKSAGEAEKARLEAELAELKKKPEAIKQREQELSRLIGSLEPKRDALWLEIPQPPDEDVPEGRSARDNVEIRRWSPEGFDPSKSFAENRGFEPSDHVVLMESHGWLDLAGGVRLSGSRSYVLRGDGFRLHQAVLRYAFDTMVDRHGFTPLSAPCLVRENTMVGTGFFPHGRDTAYHISNPTSEDQLFLAGTGEVGLMGLHADQILEADALPLTYTTISTCFRREAGAAGRDTAGLYRIHQFDKVEQVVLCRADETESRAWHKKMMGFVEEILQSLGLPHRFLQCCTADLGPKNADMIDIECWMPSRGEEGSGDWGETHSASRLYDFQCRRLNVRYKDPETGKNVFCHSLNNTVAASPRLLIPLIEMHQKEDGSIHVPEPLRPYLGGRAVLGG
ncbi:MAG: serine--tRNA ligase [Phycisphaeraceae bacterium]|nr:serine--tRNA ligase [Phycisphaeraceae bacterium]